MRIAVLGLGNVGLNLLSIMQQHGAYHAEYVGEPIELAAAGDFRHTVFSSEAMDLDRIIYYKKKGDIWGAGYEDIEREDIFLRDIDILVDVSAATRDGNFGRDMYLRAFQNNMDVATASKSPLANHWSEIMNSAAEHERAIRYESTVAGGVPLFSFLNYCLNASPPVSFRGVVHGTANFVLSRMADGNTMEEAIDKARELGIAEADVSLDIDGYDNAWKALIVANTLSENPVDIKDLKFEGIREYLKRTGGKIDRRAKLISDITMKDGVPLISAAVHDLESSEILSSLGPDSLGYVIRTGTNETAVVGIHDGPIETAAGVMNDILLLARKRAGKH